MLGAGGELERVRKAKTCRLEERLAVRVSRFLTRGCCIFFHRESQGYHPRRIAA